MMRILRHFQHCPDAARGAALALGNFDGVHRGHQAVLAEVRRLAQTYGAPAAAMTFEPHPRRVFNPEMPPLRIVPFHVKARLLRDTGLDALFVIHFTPRFAQTSAEAFVREILIGQLGVRHVVVGRDFHFGHNREGNAAYLKQAAETLSFGFTQLAGVSAGSEPCSSSAVRALLAEGRVAEAGALLGRAYEIDGRIVTGHQRGRTIGFPTANLLPHGIGLPRLGVYAVEMAAGGDAWTAPQWMPGIANLGKRPTFHGTQVTLETHLFDRAIDLYGAKARVRLLEFLRPEQAFDGVEALRAQIQKDASQARAFHARRSDSALASEPQNV